MLTPLRCGSINCSVSLLFSYLFKVILNNKLSECYDSQKKTSGDFRKLLQERIYKTNPRPKSLTKEEKTKLIKLEAMATNLRCGENVRSDG